MLMLLGVAGLSLMPVDGIDIGASDKTLHLLTYCLLAGWFCLLARNRVALARSVVALIAYGVLIEWLQGMTGYRYAEWGDVVANASGCLLGTLGYLAPVRRLFNRVDARLASAWVSD